jgi:hypothetical protein
MKVLHNTFLFEIVRYFDNKAVVSITPTESAGEVEYRTELIDNLTTNAGGGFEEWVKDSY